MSSTKSPFLHILPPELRIHIYEHLLVACTPLKGTIARGTETYNLSTAILRTNKQIHDEARSIFFGKNTFCITSIPPLSISEEEEGSGAFEPPLQLHVLPLVRHMELDLLYYPPKLHMAPTGDGSWSPVCPAAERYVTSLSHLLHAVRKSLVSLCLTADTRRYGGPATITSADGIDVFEIVGTPMLEDDNDNDDENDYYLEEGEGDEEEALDINKVLIGFHIADTNPRFQPALAGLALEQVALHFDFEESYFDFQVERDVLCGESLASLAAQVLVKRCEFGRRVELGDDDDWEDGIAPEGSVDLVPHAALAWPWGDGGDGVEQGARMVQMRK